MNKKIWLAITVLMLIWGLVVFAGPPPSLNITDAELEALWGTDITAREFLERYGPEMLVWMRHLNPDFYANLGDILVGWGCRFGGGAVTELRWEEPGDPPTCDHSRECPEATAVMERVEQAYTGIDSFYAVQTEVDSQGDMFQVHMWYEFPYMRIEIHEPFADQSQIEITEVMLYDFAAGILFVHYSITDQWREFQVPPLVKEPLLGEWFGLQEGLIYTSLEEGEFAGRPVWIVQGVQPVLQSETTFWIDQETHLVVRFSVGARTVYIEEFIIDLTIPAEKFAVPAD